MVNRSNNMAETVQAKISQSLRLAQQTGILIRIFVNLDP